MWGFCVKMLNYINFPISHYKKYFKHNGYHVEVRSERKKSRSHRKNHRSSPPIPTSHGRKPLRHAYPVNI